MNEDQKAKLEYLDGLFALMKKHGVSRIEEDGFIVKMAPPEPVPEPRVERPAIDPAILAAIEELKGDPLAEVSGVTAFRRSEA